MTDDTADISIRDESPEDHEAVRAVTIDAFAHSDFGHNGEADLIEVLRGTSLSLSLVAYHENELVGHILFTLAEIRLPNSTMYGVGLGPMSVATNHQRQGIGSLLVSTGLDRLSKTNCSFAVVLGHPDFYSRFGFVPASSYGVVHGFAGIPQDVFFIRSIDDSLKMASLVDGLAYYQPEFGAQHVDL